MTIGKTELLAGFGAVFLCPATGNAVQMETDRLTAVAMYAKTPVEIRGGEL